MTAGLVSQETSDTARSVEIDPLLNRVRRLRRSVKWSAHLHSLQRRGERAWRCAMVTLTYRPGVEWSPLHVSAFLKNCREFLRRRHGIKFRYTWVAELQKRGAVHYHCLVWLPKGITLPKPDKRGWWPHGMTEIAWARTPVGYITKYASKAEGVSAFPKGLRLHGAGGFDDFSRDVKHWVGLPSWLRGQVGVGERVRRVPGVGLVLAATGECIASPWRVSINRGTVTARELFRYADPVRCTGPYSRLVPSNFERLEVAHA